MNKSKRFADMNDYYKIVNPDGQYPLSEDSLDVIVSGRELIKEFEFRTGKKIGIAYESEYSRMVVDLVYVVPGSYFAYERLFGSNKKPGTVVLAFHNDNVILLNQYRHAIRRYDYAIVRGFVNSLLSSEDNIKKELEEEIGAYGISDIRLLGRTSVDTGMTDKETVFYSCNVLGYDENLRCEGISEIFEIPVSHFEYFLSKGKITDSFTVQAYFFWKLRFDSRNPKILTCEGKVGH